MTQFRQQDVCREAVEPENGPTERYEPGLKRPQVTLKGLFFLVSFCVLLLATFQAAGPLAGWSLLLFALAVFAHVAGNSLGTQLRDATDNARLRERSMEQPTQPHHFAERTHLAHRVQLRWPMLVLTLICAIIGSFLGGSFLAEVNAAQATTANLALAYGSCGVLGAILGFGASMFLKVVLEALWQAHQAD